jgi:hypothetical protein
MELLKKEIQFQFLSHVLVCRQLLKSRKRMSVKSFSTKSAAGNKYLEKDDDVTSEEDEDYNVHEITRTGTYTEVKDVIARDRPRLIALKDQVSLVFVAGAFFTFLAWLLFVLLLLLLAWKNCSSLCC